jgi:hypothetical protein
MPIDFPGAIVTDASGINSTGEIVGTYTDAGNVVHEGRFVGAFPPGTKARRLVEVVGQRCPESTQAAPSVWPANFRASATANARSCT